MTTPRPHAELAARYFADDTLKCWVRNKGSNDDWSPMHAPAFNTGSLYATAADAQAWADFDLWCRGGAV